MLDFESDPGRRAAERLGQETVVWLTTVRADGQPQSSPVWFTWDGQEVLLYGQSGSPKVRNVRANPRVSLHFDSDGTGGDIVTFEGEARIDERAPAVPDEPAYMAKYREGIARIEMTPEEYGQDYSVAIRVRPSRVRVY